MKSRWSRSHKKTVMCSACGNPVTKYESLLRGKSKIFCNRSCQFSTPIMERFMSKVHKTDSCWIWIGSKVSNRYGGFHNGTETLAHRTSWIIFKGEIPVGMEVLHRCDNGLCCNPNHLFLGTQRDNVHDMYNKGRDRNLRGEQTTNSKLTTEQVKQIKRLLSARKLLDREIASMFGVARVSVNHIRSGRTWKHVSV